MFRSINLIFFVTQAVFETIVRYFLSLFFFSKIQNKLISVKEKWFEYNRDSSKRKLL